LGGSFQELPDTEDEAKEIKQILQAPDQSQPLQLQAAASRSQVLRLQKENRLENYRYVVFACHGVLPGEVDQVRQPALVLSHPDPQTKGDGYLTMADIFGLKLNADLVSLSACNTGRGKLEKGEGVVGLTRAFMYAGTPALSVTLWSVESGSARRLNTGLYQNLEAKNSRAQALRRIKQEMIRGDQAELYRHPFFWAPLVLFGEGGS
jgi:CHAT domain-containing protein